MLRAAELSRVFVSVAGAPELLVRIRWIDGTLGGSVSVVALSGLFGPSVGSVSCSQGPVLLCRCCAGLGLSGLVLTARPAVLGAHRLRRRLVGRWMAPARRKRALARLAVYEAKALSPIFLLQLLLLSAVIGASK